MNAFLLVLIAMSGSITCCFGYINSDRGSSRRCHGVYTNINNSNDDGINESYYVSSALKSTPRREVFNIALQRTFIASTIIITSSLVPPKQQMYINRRLKLSIFVIFEQIWAYLGTNHPDCFF